jgi:hypothetical protein
MKITKQDVLSYVVPASIGIIIGLCLVKCTSKPVDNIKIERDTVVVVDTAYYDRPAPKDSVRTKWVTRWLPASPDTIDHFIGANMDHYADTSKMIAVEVPITSKHYGSKDYDAWVSGYEPSLDSIKVYQRTEYITERVTISKPPNRWELDLIGGLDYNTARQDFTPYAGGEILYKPNRLQVGARAGVSKTANAGKVEPFIGGVVKIKIF